jgi:hypothetical protein
MSLTSQNPASIDAQQATAFKPRFLLLAAFFAYFLYAIMDLRLVFEARDTLFLWNKGYFLDFLGQPGWLLRWFDPLWVQLCHDGWAGTLILVFLFWSLLVSTAAFMDSLAGSHVRGTWIIPAVGLFYIHGSYTAQTFAITGAALAMAAAWGWSRFSKKSPSVWMTVFILLTAILYYLIGEACVCFAACSLIYIGVHCKSWRWLLTMVLIATGIKFGLDTLLGQLCLSNERFHAPALETDLLNWKNSVFFAFFPLCTLCVAFRKTLSNTPIWNRLLQSQHQQETRKHTKNASVKSSKHKEPLQVESEHGFSWLRWSLGTVVILAMAAITGYSSQDRNTKSLLEIDYCVSHKLWDEVLTKARKLKVYSQYTNHDVNLALYHTGKMPYELFAHLQLYSILLDQEQIRNGAVAMVRKPCDLLLELGRVNEAEHTALELLEIYPTGQTLKRLALIKIIKNEPEAARLFLNVLSDDLIAGNWARQQLEKLQTRSDFADDPMIQEARRNRLTKDDLSSVCRINTNTGTQANYYAMLENLIKHNPKNQMAFEYLMSMYLLDGNLQGVVDLIPSADSFSYPTLPPCYEEAALIYGTSHPTELVVNSSGVYFRNRRISDATAAKFKQLRSIVNQSGGSIPKALPAISRELQGSYFAYFLTQRGSKNA